MHRDHRFKIGARPGQLLWGLLGVLAVCLAAYWNVVLRGETLVASSNRRPFDYRIAHLRPGGVRPPAHLGWHDLSATWRQWEPAGMFFSDAFREGRVPQWNPLLASGTDAHVKLTQGQYFPPYMLILLLGNTPLARDAYYLAVLLTAGLACFLLLWRRGCHPLAGVGMAAVYMLGGTMTANINSIVGQAYGCLPVVVLATDWFLSRPDRRRTAGLAAVASLAILASFLPVIAMTFLLCGLLVVVTVIAPVTRFGKHPAGPFPVVVLGHTALAFGVGAALCGFLLVPFLAATLTSPVFQTHYEGAGLDVLPWKFFLTWVSPRLSYGIHQEPGALFPVPAGYHAHLPYVGAVTLMIAGTLMASDDPRSRRLLVFFWTAGLLSFLKLHGVPPVQWLGHLPALRQLHFDRYLGGLLAFALAGLFGLAIDRVLRARTLGRHVIRAGCVTLLLGGLLVLVTHELPLSPKANLTAYYREAGRVAAACVLVLGALWLHARGHVGGRAATLLLLLALGMELQPLAARRRFQRHDAWRHVPKYVRFVQSDNTIFRVHGAHRWALHPNTAQGLGIASLGSLYAFNETRYDTLLRRLFDIPLDSQFLRFRRLLPEPRRALDWLGVKYLVEVMPAEEARAVPRGADLTPVLTDGRFRLWRNPHVWPRAYVANRFRLARDPAHAMALTLGLQAPTEVVLEQRPSGVPESGLVAVGARADVVRYEPDRVLIEVESPTSGLVVLHDSFAPGWSAKVDGRPAEVLIANYAFRGVEVPAGRTRVVMRYHTPYLGMGLVVSVLSLCGLVGLATYRGRGGVPQSRRFESTPTMSKMPEADSKGEAPTEPKEEPPVPL